MQNNYEVLKFLSDIEKELKITILFACETGSKAVGTAVQNSDFDVKGLYIAKEEEYLQIVRKINPTFVKHHLSITVESKHHDIDVELVDLQKYLRNKIDKNNTRSDFWFYSDIVYINRFTDEELSLFKKYSHPPIFIYSLYDKSGIKTLEKHIKNNQKILNKKLLCLSVSGIQFLHTVIYYLLSEENSINENEFEPFPFYNIFKEIEFLKTKQIVLCNFFSEEEIKNFQINFNLCYGLYQKKKQNRLSVTEAIPENLKKFIELLLLKFHDKIKTKTHPDFPIDFAESIFKNYLYKFNN
jgi:predicted nucleotidyltransferase